MNCALTLAGKKVGGKHQSGKEICSFSLEPCLAYGDGKAGAGYICPFTLETFDSIQKGIPRLPRPVEFGPVIAAKLPPVVRDRSAWSSDMKNDASVTVR